MSWLRISEKLPLVFQKINFIIWHYILGHQNDWTLGINTEPISGAYLFNPEKVVHLPIKESKIFQSNGWMELHVIYQNDWWGYIVRKHAKMSHLEIEWFVNPINITDRYVYILDIFFRQITMFIKLRVAFVFWAVGTLIDRFYKNLSIKVSRAQKQRPHKFF